jgi:hypothetical protein
MVIAFGALRHNDRNRTLEGFGVNAGIADQNAWLIVEIVIHVDLIDRTAFFALSAHFENPIAPAEAQNAPTRIYPMPTHFPQQFN